MHGAIWSSFFCSKLDTGFNGLDMLQELVFVCCFMDDKGIIQIPSPQSWMIGLCSHGHGFKNLYKNAGHYWAHG